jgi:hypothetical protein
MFIFKTIQILPRLRDEQNPLVFPIGKTLFPDRFGIPIAQIDLPTNLLRYPCGQDHPRPWLLHPVLIGSATMNMGRMS